MIMNKEKSTKSIILKIFKWIAYVLIAIIFIFVAWVSIDRLTYYNAPIFGYRFSVIASESMSYVNESNKEFLEGHDDQLQVNDLIITEPINDINDLNVYDIITFIDDDNTLICHRIVEIDLEDGVIWTQGDANNTRDGVVTIDEVKGRVIAVIPQIGVVTLYIASPYGLLGISIALTIIFAAVLVNEILKSKEKKQLETTNNVVVETIPNTSSSEEVTTSNKEESSLKEEITPPVVIREVKTTKKVKNNIDNEKDILINDDTKE